MSAFFPVISTLSPAAPQLPARRAASPSILATSAAKQWDARLSHTPIHDNAYYAKCMVAGVLSCGLTHTAITPLDVVKCNMQVNPGKFNGLVQGIKTIAAEEGSAALFKGWAPTAIGYSAQGLCKFGFYEYFKDTYSTMAGEENAYKYRGLIYLAGSASAELIADVALCPMEMIKVKVQTSPAGTFPVEFGPALAAMRANSAETRFPFGSVVPLWSRQIPYTMAKFFFFEKVVEGFYTYVFTEPKSTYPKSTQLGVTFASGYLAGVICAIVSHPADSVVSLMGKAENKGKSIGTIASETGLKNLATKGLGTRIIMIGTLTGLQWWIYDTFKTVFGMGTSGGAPAKKRTDGNLREEERVHGHDDERAGDILTLALADARGLPAETREPLVLARLLAAVEDRGELHAHERAHADKEQDHGDQPLETEERGLMLGEATWALRHSAGRARLRRAKEATAQRVVDKTSLNLEVLSKNLAHLTYGPQQAMRRGGLGFLCVSGQGRTNKKNKKSGERPTDARADAKMNRLPQFAQRAAKIGAGALVGGSVLTGVTAFSGDQIDALHYGFDHTGPLSSFDYASVRRGYQVYKEVCSTCHSLERICFRNLVGVIFSEDEAKAAAADIDVVDGPNAEGEMFERPGKLSDPLPKPYANDEAAAAANNGAIPPDLSLMSKARVNGPDYLFALLTGYVEPPEGKELLPGLYYNPYFGGGAIAMERQLNDGQLEYADGTPATTSQMAKDVAVFLAWAAEPEHDVRKKQGFQTALALAGMVLLTGYYKRVKWAPLKTRKITYTK